jgi:hypothetical protein
MGCTSCGKARQTVSPDVAAAIASGRHTPPQFTVISPDGSRTTFDRYIDAVVFKRQVNGTLTTHNPA